MKRKTIVISWSSRLIASAMVVLISQHAFAAGTAAGVTISNQAQVDYAVGGTAQTYILSDPAGNSTPGPAVTSGALPTSFVVDNRVDFSLVESGLIGHTLVTPGQSTEYVQFTLENHGNETQDFLLLATDLIGGTVGTPAVTDTTDMTSLLVYVDNDGNGLNTAVDQPYVDELAPDSSVTIYVVGTAPVDMANGAAANINLQATVADAGSAGNPGIATVDNVGDPDTTGVDVVFAEGFFASGGTVFTLGDGILDAQDGFLGSSAALTITKTATLVSDPFNGTASPKAIPGAVIEYVITVNNTGAQTAQNIVIGDTLSGDITVVNDFFGANEVQIDNDGTVSTCSQEDTDTDNCEIVGGALSVGGDAAIDVLANTILTITFRVTIN